MFDRGEVVMILLDGKKVQTELLEELKEKISKAEDVLGLAVIQVGGDAASDVYVRQKKKMAEVLGMRFFHEKLAGDIQEEALLELINKLNQDDDVDGILVQMPLPEHLNAKKIRNAIDYRKDVDGLTDWNMGGLVCDQDVLVACTPMGIMDLLDYYHIDVEGANVVIVGRSDLVGKPLLHLMLKRNATVVMAHSKTRNLQEITQKADILVVAIGKAQFITEEYVKEGAVVVDVGIHRVGSKLMGDVNFETVKEKTSYITPVPGGVGPMTVAELGRNVYQAYALRRKI